MTPIKSKFTEKCRLTRADLANVIDQVHFRTWQSRGSLSTRGQLCSTGNIYISSLTFVDI